MTISRRTFIVSAGTLPFMSLPPEAHPRMVVIDQTFVSRFPRQRHDEVTVLTGDAAWLWHEHLCHETAITGFTRYADAFILMRLAIELGMQVTQRFSDDDAILWSLRRPRSFR